MDYIEPTLITELIEETDERNKGEMSYEYEYEEVRELEFKTDWI